MAHNLKPLKQYLLKGVLILYKINLYKINQTDLYHL